MGTAVLCEMLRAYTVKSKKSVWNTFNRNKTMHFACFISFAVTILLTIIPGVKNIMRLETPDFLFYICSCFFAFCCMANDEVWKFFYRRKLHHRYATVRAEIKRQEGKEKMASVLEMVHKVEIGRQRIEEKLLNVEEFIHSQKSESNSKTRPGDRSRKISGLINTSLNLNDVEVQEKLSEVQE